MPSETPEISPTDTRPKFTLSSIITEQVFKPPRILLYGVDGIGKSTFASKFPNSIFIATEDGAERIGISRFPTCVRWLEIFEALTILGKQQNDYKTLVIDSIDWAQSLAIKHTVATYFENDITSFEAYGRGYKIVIQEFRKLFEYLDRLHKARGMGIIIVAHATIRTFQNPAGDNYDRYTANLIDGANTSIWSMAKQWADMVLFANYNVAVRKNGVKEQKGKGVMIESAAGSRICHAAPSAAWDAKVRAGWELPAAFPLNYDEFEKHVI